MESACGTNRSTGAAIRLSTLTLRARVRVQSTESVCGCYRGETCPVPRGDVLPRDSRFSANNILIISYITSRKKNFINMYKAVLFCDVTHECNKIEYWCFLYYFLFTVPFADRFGQHRGIFTFRTIRS